MSTKFGEARVVKELKIEVDKNLQVSGYAVLVSKGKVNFTGQLRSFNEKYVHEIDREKELPLALHLKFNKTVKPNEQVGYPGSNWGDKSSAKEFTKYLKSPQNFSSLRIFKFGEKGFMIEGFTTPYGDLNFSIYKDTENIFIFEEKNIKKVS